MKKETETQKGSTKTEQPSRQPPKEQEAVTGNHRDTEKQLKQLDRKQALGNPEGPGASTTYVKMSGKQASTMQGTVTYGQEVQSKGQKEARSPTRDPPTR
jgi:hypothetical protein